MGWCRGREKEKRIRKSSKASRLENSFVSFKIKKENSKWYSSN
jgi:hypothetical protein